MNLHDLHNKPENLKHHDLPREELNPSAALRWLFFNSDKRNPGVEHVIWARGDGHMIVDAANIIYGHIDNWPDIVLKALADKPLYNAGAHKEHKRVKYGEDKIFDVITDIERNESVHRTGLKSFYQDVYDYVEYQVPNGEEVLDKLKGRKRLF